MTGTDFRGIESDAPLVSVCCLCFNQSQYLEESLNGILNQTYPNIQLIIVDDCSTDGSADLIQAWIDRHELNCEFVRHEQNQGICPTINDALSRCRGKYFQGNACDDVLLPEKIASQVEVFETLDDSWGVVYSDAMIVGPDGDVREDSFIWQHLIGRSSAAINSHVEEPPVPDEVPTGSVYSQLLRGNYIPGIASLRKVDILKSMGGFNEDLKYEDYDMWLRIARDYKFYYLDQKCACYRLHGSNEHISIASDFTEQNYWIYRQHYDHPFAQVHIKLIIDKLHEQAAFRHPAMVDFVKNLSRSRLNSAVIRLRISFENYQKLLAWLFWLKQKLSRPKSADKGEPG